MKKIKFLLFACLAFAFTLVSTSLSAQQARTGEHVKQKMAKKLQTLKKVDGNLLQVNKATPTSSTQDATLKSKTTPAKKKTTKTYKTRPNANKQPTSLLSVQTTKKSGQGNSNIVRGKRFEIDPAKKAERVAQRRVNAKKVDKTAVKAKIKKLNQ